MRIMFSRITYIYFINVQLSYDLFQSKLEHKYHTVYAFKLLYKIYTITLQVFKYNLTSKHFRFSLKFIVKEGSYFEFLS